jgi:hypothetical protein
VASWIALAMSGQITWDQHSGSSGLSIHSGVVGSSFVWCWSPRAQRTTALWIEVIPLKAWNKPPTRLISFALLTFLLLIGSGCTTCRHSAGRSFVLGKDSFAFANELQWSYEFLENGEVITREAKPSPKYSLRCFPTVRMAREFFYHARFAPDLPKATAEVYEQLTKKIVKRNSRCPAAPEERIVIPGYADLFAFSAEHEPILRRACGGPLHSYFQRGNWRMIFPVSRWKNRRTAGQLRKEISKGRVPIIHVYRFPTVSLNHSVLVYGVKQDGDQVLFEAYDPNNPGRPASLVFQRDSGAFLFERNQYFGGGRVQVYEVFRGCCY